MDYQNRRLTGRRLNRQTQKGRHADRRATANRRSHQIEYETSIHKILGKYRDRIESNEPLTREQYYEIFRNYPKPVRESIKRSVQWAPNMTWNKYLTAIAATIGIVLAASAVAAAASYVATTPAQSSSSYSQAPMYTPPVSSQSLMNPTPVSNVSMKPNRKQEVYEFEYSKPYKAPRQQESQPQKSKDWLGWWGPIGAAGSPTNAPNSNVNGIAIRREVIQELVNNKEILNNAVMKYDILRKQLAQTKTILADKCVSAKVDGIAVCKNNKVDDLNLSNLEGEVTVAFIAVEKARELVKASYNNLAMAIIDEIVKEFNIGKDKQTVFKNEVTAIIHMDRNQLLQRQTARERAIHSIVTPELKTEEEVKIMAIKAVIKKNVKERLAKLEKSAIKHTLTVKHDIAKGEAFAGLDPSDDIEIMVDIAKIADITMKIFIHEHQAQTSHNSARPARVNLSKQANAAFEAAKNDVKTKEGLEVKAQGNVTAADNNFVTANNKLVTFQATYDTANATFVSANKNFIDKNNTYVEAHAIMFDFVPKFLDKYHLKSIEEIDKVPKDNVDFIRLMEIMNHVTITHDSLPPAQEAADNAKASAETAKAALDLVRASAETAKASAETAKAKAAFDVAKANVVGAKIAEAAAKAKADATAAAIDGPIDINKVTKDPNEIRAISSANQAIEERQKLKEEQDRQREKAKAEAIKWDYLLVSVGVIGHVYSGLRRGWREEKEFKELCENEVHRIEQLQNPINIYITNFKACADSLQTLERHITIQNCLDIKIFSRECLARANEMSIAITRFIDGSILNVTLPGDQYYAALHQRARHIANLNLDTRGHCTRIMGILNRINTRIQENRLCPPLEPQVNEEENEEENDGLLGFMGGGKSLRKVGRRTRKRMYRKSRSTRKRHHRR